MSNKNLSDKPQETDKDTWYYEEPGGIEIIHQTKSNAGQEQFVHLKISWRKLAASLKRKQAK